ncbi:MAG TPA: LPS export ABC transporter periplasmic protein LptC [Gemmatimonadaceae bacterium]|nr:LPS export ABC transporter periplasmic protein LptC [Gemmatimonadaceae bacterium]
MRGRVLLTLAAAVVVGAACNSGTEPPVTALNPLADSADQVLFGVTMYVTDSGLRRARLLADTAYFFDNSSRIELRGVRTTFYTPAGAENAVLTSQEGTSNSARSQVEARKNVVVVSTDGKRLTTEQLRYNQTTNQISSDSAFVLTEQGRRLEGIGFISDPNLTHVHVLHQPAGGGTFTLPGQ